MRHGPLSRGNSRRVPGCFGRASEADARCNTIGNGAVKMPSFGNSGVLSAYWHEASHPSLTNEKPSVQIRGRDGDDQHHDENTADNKAAINQRADGNAWFAQWQ